VTDARAHLTGGREGRRGLIDVDRNDEVSGALGDFDRGFVCRRSGAHRRAAERLDKSTGVRVRPAGPTALSLSATASPTAYRSPRSISARRRRSQLPGLGKRRCPAREQRVSSLIVPAGTPIATAVAQLGANLGWTVSVDPDMRGTAYDALRDVTVAEALKSYRATGMRTNCRAQQGPCCASFRSIGIAHVRLDYVALSRVGTMSTIVSGD
jgi:hypothetical protein